jgi:hypothetical protein
MLLLIFSLMMFFFAVILLMYVFSKDRDELWLFGAAGIMLMLLAVRVGQLTMQEREYKYKKKPVVHIECNGKKCDTTYIYKF